MATTHDGVVDLIGDVIKAAWDAQAAGIAGGSPKLVYEWLDRSGKPPANDDESWARLTIRHDAGSGASIGGKLSKRFVRGGFVWVQVFVPWVDGTKPPKSIALGRVVLNAIQDRRSGEVTMTQAKLEEKGQDRAWYRVDVTARFSWFERRPLP